MVKMVTTKAPFSFISILKKMFLYRQPQNRKSKKKYILCQLSVTFKIQHEKSYNLVLAPFFCHFLFCLKQHNNKNCETHYRGEEFVYRNNAYANKTKTKT